MIDISVARNCATHRRVTTSQPTNRSRHRTLVKRREVTLERIRPEAKKRQRVRKPKPPRSAPKLVRCVHPTEERLLAILRQHNVEFLAQQQVEPFELDLKGKGKTRFQPDFYLPDYEVYIEVTASQNQLGLARKASKIASAARVGKTVILIDLERLRELETGAQDLFELVSPDPTVYLRTA